ncbi:MAG TPA: TonB-dependent receptor plug domain-containing protein, partial [Burkholderiaceae bacterium]
MASSSRTRRAFALRHLTPVAAALALAGVAQAQTTQTVQVTAHGPDESAGVGGFAQPLARTPLQAEVVDAKTLADLGATSLSDLTRVDASLTDAYNAIGYWTTFSVRGFQVDNRYNFRRDGLPINAETMLPLENKASVEVLKGLSGMQAGTSAPGGLVNLVVKRPDADLRSASLGWREDGTVAAAVDLSQRFGADRQFGARVNASVARLDPNVDDAKGHRQTASIATDWRIDPDRLLEFEFEHSLQSQPSVPGFSMLGDVLPDPHSVDPRLNLNDQPWSLPVVMQGNTMSLRYTQALGADWKLRVHALQQALVSNDHLAFDYGLYDPATYACDPCDRFSSDG